MLTVPGDPMEDFFDTERKALSLDRSVKSGARKTTQQLADEYSLADRAGVAREVVAANPELKPDLDWQAKVMNTPIGELVGTTPKVAAYLGEHPDNFTAHQDGLTTLQLMERKHQVVEDHRRKIEEENAKNGTGYFGGLVNTFSQGSAQLLTMPGDITEILLGKFGSKEDVQAFQLARSLGIAFSPGVNAGGVALNVLDKIGRDNLSYLRSGPQRQREDLLVRDPKTGEEQFNFGAINLENALAIVAGELPSFTVQAAAAPFTGGASLAPKLAKLGKIGKVIAPLIKYGTRPAAGLEVARTVTSVYDQGKRQMMAQGMSEAEAGQKVAGGALLAGLLSMPGAALEARFFDDMVNKIAAAPGGFGVANQLRARAQAVATMGAKEGVQEVVQGMGEDLAQWLTFQPDMTMKQAAGNAIMNFFGGAIMGGPAGGIALGSNQIAAAQQRDFLDAIHQGAENSPAYKLMPQKWQEAVAKITEGGPVENVSVPVARWMTFWQEQGMDPAVKAAELGITPQEYAEAIQTGTDLTIKTAEFGAKIAGTEAYPELIQDVRWNLGEPTEREATEQKAELDSQVKEILAKIEAEPENKIQTIADKLVEDLIAVGRPKQEAQAEGKLYRQFMATMAARSGMAPEELASQFPLSIIDGQAQMTPLANPAEGNIIPQQGATNDPGTGLPEVSDAAGRAGGGTFEQAWAPADAAGRGPGPVGSEPVRLASLPASDKLQSYQLRNAPVLSVNGTDVVAGPRPPYFSFHGNPNQDGQVKLSASPTNVAGSGVYVAQSHAVASAKAHTQENGQTLSVYVDTRRLAPLDARVERSYSPEEAKAFGMEVGGPINGQELLVRLNDQHGAGDGLTEFLKGLGFNAVSYDYTSQEFPAWSIFDPSVFKRVADTKAWSPEEIARREAFDPEPIGQSFGQSEATMKPVDINSPEFQAWFGDSKVVDKAGAPLRLFHGSPDARFADQSKGDGIFKTKREALLGADDPQRAFFFADNERVARTYADPQRAFDYQNAEEGVVPVYLSLKNPMVIDAKGEHWRGTAGTIEEARAAGHDGIIIKNSRDTYMGRKEQKGVPMTDVYVAFDPTQIKSAISNVGTFDPNNPSILYQDGKRGALHLGPNHQMSLQVFESANVSTVAHELGHFYLEVMRDLASRPEADQQTKDDFATIMKHFGEGEDGVTTLLHERFADAHLLYLQEGKSPTEELRGAFQRFSQWLTRIWGAVKAGMVNVQLNPEVRGVFDRLYATEQEIEAAKYDLGRPMFATAEAAGMTEAEFQAYLKTTNLAQAKEKMVQRLMHEMQRSQSQERRDAYNTARERITTEVMSRPEYQALMALVKGENADGIEVKLSKQALVDRGIDPKSLAKDGATGYVYTTEGGMDPDTAALFLGYDSGDALVQALTNLEPRKAIINRLATAEVEQEFPNTLKDPAAMRKAAIDAMAESPQAERTLALELQVIERKRKEAAPTVKAMEQQQRQQTMDDKAAAREAAKLPNMRAYREAARIMVDGMPAFKLTPYKYLLAQRKASAEAFKAMAKNDYTTAAEAKRQEITNHFLYLETTRVRQEMEDFLKWDSRFEVGRFREKIGKAGGTFLEQIDALRLRFGLTERQLENMGTRKESLAQWIATNEMAEIDDRIADESWSKPYHQLSVAEANMLWDALKNIKTLAYQEFNVMVNGRMVEKQAAAQQIVDSILAHNTTKPLLLSGSKETAQDKAMNRLKGFDATLVKMEALINWMDGGKVDGPAHRYLWDPLAKAQTDRYDLTVKIAQPLQEAFRQMPENVRKNLDETLLVDGFNQPLTRRQIISMLLNMGNEVNQTKLVKGYNWTTDQLLSAVGKLTAEEATFVQHLWDTVSTLWPDMVALEKRTTGVEPKKQEIREFALYNDQGQKIADLKGGYWPLKYDPQGSTDVGMKQNAADRLLQGSSARPGTSRSAVKERTNFTGELLLDFEHILTAHINDVIMDLSHREALNTVDKMVRMPEVKMAIQEAFGPAYYQQFQPWLKTIAGDNSSAAAMGLSVWSRAAMGIRSNTIAAVLGFKFTSTIVQFADVLRVIAPGDYRVKSRYFTGAFLQLMGDPKGTVAMVRELSGEMRHRAENLDRDVRETLNRMTGKQSIKDRWNRAAFKGLAFMDALVSVPAWLGAYQQAMAEHGDSDKAVAEADRVVRMKLMSGNPKDMVGVQRDNEMMKLITMFLGDASAQYNMMRNAGQKAKGLGGFVTQFTPAAMVVMAGAIIGDLLKGAGPDDDEDKAKWAIRKAALAPFQTVPGLRDAATALDAKLSDKPFADYRFTPAFTPVQKIIAGIDATTDLLGEEGKVDEVDWALKSGEAIGYAFGIGGTAQAAGAAKYLRRVETGEENPDNAGQLLYNTVNGKPRKGTR